MNKLTQFIGRLFLAQIYLVSIVIQLTLILKNPHGYDMYQTYLGQQGLPGIFAPLMILIQLVGGIALLIGYKTRAAAYLLALYSVFVAVVLKLDEPILFMQYLAIAGGFFILAANPRTALSIDGFIGKQPQA